MKTKFYLLSLLCVLLGLSSCNDEPDPTPTVTINNAEIKIVGKEGTQPLYNITAEATLDPMKKKVVEGGFIYSYFYGMDLDDMINGSNITAKVPCEVIDNKMSLDVKTSSPRYLHGNYAYIMAYMILSDGTIVGSDSMYIEGEDFNNEDF